MRRIGMGAAWAAALLLALAACGPQARVKGEEEGSLVGARAAGAETYNKLIEETSRKLLDEHRARLKEGQKKIICFVDVEKKSAEELGENKEAIYELMDAVIVESGVYTNVSRRYVEAALRDTGLRADEIFLADGRARFLSVLQREGVSPDYLLWGVVTSLSTKGAEMREREYMLTMEMVDAKTGLVDAKKISRVRKEYKR